MHTAVPLDGGMGGAGPAVCARSCTSVRPVASDDHTPLMPEVIPGAYVFCGTDPVVKEQTDVADMCCHARHVVDESHATLHAAGVLAPATGTLTPPFLAVSGCTANGSESSKEARMALVELGLLTVMVKATAGVIDPLASNGIISPCAYLYAGNASRG